MTTYETLGIPRVINAFATLTRLGGSLMPPEVVTAMQEGAQSFIELPELQRRVGERIAELTHNEAAYISSGAAAGLSIATAAIIAGNNREKVTVFPNLDGLKNEVIVQKGHRNGYDYAVQQTGAKIINIEHSPEALRQAINAKTAAVFWFQGVMTTPDNIPLAEVIKIAHEYDVPVVVDAAAQLPPVSNLWSFTQMGADLAVFSGGKDLRGPQSSGLVLGRRDLIEACRIHANPNQSFGRPMKVGKEEMMGILAAVERYIQLDHAARERHCEETVTMWCSAWGAYAGMQAERSFPNEAGQPLPRCKITFAADHPLGRDTFMQQLESGDPPIFVAPSDDNGVYVNPMTLEPGEEQIVLERISALLDRQ